MRVVEGYDWDVLSLCLRVNVDMRVDAEEVSEVERMVSGCAKL